MSERRFKPNSFPKSEWTIGSTRFVRDGSFTVSGEFENESMQIFGGVVFAVIGAGRTTLTEHNGLAALYVNDLTSAEYELLLQKARQMLEEKGLSPDNPRQKQTINSVLEIYLI